LIESGGKRPFGAHPYLFEVPQECGRGRAPEVGEDKWAAKYLSRPELGGPRIAIHLCAADAPHYSFAILLVFALSRRPTSWKKPLLLHTQFKFIRPSCQPAVAACIRKHLAGIQNWNTPFGHPQLLHRIYFGG